MSKTIIIIVIIAALGVLGYMLYASMVNQREAGQRYSPERQAQVAPADETAQVDADLKFIQTDGLDAELGDIQKEIAK